PPPPPSATPTAGLTRCVTLEWSASQAFDPILHVLVEVEMRNDCGRDLEPLAVWVRVQGWRQGGLVQEVMGHPFFRLDAGGRQHFGVGLPGSLDWFDDIRVEVEEPASP
ncbi:MAG TPA: hypothetical protein PKL08_16865, partial [Thermoanaerobaculaceae bacterium]|nr:hypothetical protein [Thermoanaerobaculaceae bacterium]